MHNLQYDACRTKAPDNRYPYAVSLQNDVIGHYCGGMLIAKDIVLTAGHCIREGSISAVLGGNDIVEGERIRVNSTIIHPNYEALTDGYDVGLMILESPTMLDIAIPSLNSNNAFPSIGSKTYALGWGDTYVATSEQVLSDSLMITSLNVISNQECDASKLDDVSYKNWIHEDMLCTFTENQDACQGDSGGPLIVRPGGGAEYDIIVGIVSWGVGCAYLPGVFSRVSMSYDWIAEVVCAYSQDITGSVCPQPPTVAPSLSPTDKQPTLTPTSILSLSSEPTAPRPTTDLLAANKAATTSDMTSLPTYNPTTNNESVIISSHKQEINSSIRLGYNVFSVVTISGLVTIYGW